jgi:hypothetical protein
MSKKKKKRNRKQQQLEKPRPRRRTSGISGSLVFVALIAFLVAVGAAISMWSGGDRPSCPPGQIWSDAHNHCH